MAEAAQTVRDAANAIRLPVTGGEAAAAALANTTPVQVIRHEYIHSGSVQFLLMGENGPWVAKSLSLDAKARHDVAETFADEFLAAVPA